ncbi:GNAT family N-acetyltransferase [Bernardetia sp. ABR2-2B]|uniref:GNAT family N-acetyltransferase n=1 Tax=Bernardetia sp. ABR2-2B TaxID=3127472 RepID=UPI0030CB1B29
MNPYFILPTMRLYLRPIDIEDAEEVFEYKSNKKANKFQGFIPKNKEEVEDFIQKKTAREINIENTWFQFVIIHERDTKIIGDVGLHFLEGGNNQVEFGITLNSEYQQQGYAKEAMKTVISYLFRDLNKHRIIASIDPRNISSIKLMKSLNMRKEAHFEKSLFFKNEWVDDLIYAILKEEYGKVL